MNEEKLAQILSLTKQANLSVRDVSEYITKLYQKDCLDEIYRLFREMNMPLKEVLDYLQKNNEEITGKSILPGMFVYDDNTFSQSIIEHRKVKAIVGYVEDGTVYALCLRANTLPWSSDSLAVKVTQDMENGQETTKTILIP